MLLELLDSELPGDGASATPGDLASLLWEDVPATRRVLLIGLFAALTLLLILFRIYVISAMVHGLAAL